MEARRGSEDEPDGADFGDDWRPDGVDPNDPLLLSCAAEPLNDIGNARRLWHRHGQDMLFVPNLGWHRWDGRRWHRADNDEDSVRPLAHDTAEAIALEAVVMRPSPREQEAMDEAMTAAERLVEIPHDIIALDDEDISKSEVKRRTRVLKDEAERLKSVVGRGELAAKVLATRQAQRRRFATTSGNSGKLDGMVREIRERVTRFLPQLDPDPLALSVLNGTIRFHRVEEPDPECPDPDEVRLRVVWRFSIRPHERADLITKLAPVFHCPEATAPLFTAFLARIVPDPEVRAFLQQFFGYCLTALTTEQMFCIFHGEGSNGKSTLVDIIARVMGDYATSVPVMSLVNDSSRKGSEATPDLIRLPAARFVRSAEPKEGLPLDESLIKDLTSGEPINVRRLNHEFVEVYPQFKLAISCNRKPKIYGNDDGIWRRVTLVPYEIQIPKAERDKSLPKKLQREMPGILNWMIEGALDFLTRGALDAPEKILAATQEYRDESDIVGAFVRAALEVTRNPNDSVEAGTLYSAFQKYCEKSAITPLGKSTFNRRMPKAAESYGFEKAKASVSHYCGIRIRREFDPSHTHYGL
ncbi:phage/plasmid primase, P4 family [Xanthobacter sediminis]